MDTRQLIAQIQTISTDYESAMLDANKWRELLAALTNRGYGPRISPTHIAVLVPSVADVTLIIQESKDPKRFAAHTKPGPKPRAISPTGPAPADPGPAHA